MLTPAGTEAASQDPEQLVPAAKPSTRSRSSRTGEDSELVAQQQVLKDEVLARPYPGHEDREQKPDEFEHAGSTADLWRARFCRPTGCFTGSWQSASER